MKAIHFLRAPVLLLGLLTGCAETQFLAHATKEFQESVGLNGHSGKTTYKVGNPYQINGVWYYPKVEYDYEETGIASWYGPNFDGKPTANGEIFDMNRVSAAHRTLPMPSLVRVTNLESGRAINVRINDRGPFAHGRIIDLSRRAAQLLGFERAGTAPVRVEILPEESRQLALQAQNLTGLTQTAEPRKPDAAPTVSVTSATLPPPAGTKSAAPPPDKFQVVPVETAPERSARSKPTLALVDEAVTKVPVVENPQIFVQAGAFSMFQNAHKVRAVLKQLGPTKITQIDRNNRPLFRVRIGPLASVSEADRILEGVIRAGYPDAATVVE
jgi:rare lipoprotein A